MINVFYVPKKKDPFPGNEDSLWIESLYKIFYPSVSIYSSGIFSIAFALIFI